MGIDGQLNIPLFHPPTAGDNRYRCTKPQPIDRPLGIFNRPYCPRCRALPRGIFDSFVAKTPPVRIELNDPRGVLRTLRSIPIYIRRCLSLFYLKSSMKGMVFATRWCEARACTSSVLGRPACVPCSFFRTVVFSIGYQTDSRSEMVDIDTSYEPQWVGSGV